MLPALEIHPTPAALAVALADALTALAAERIAAGGRFDLVLAGGSTPRELYSELARRRAGDTAWHVWYGDERCLPPEHPERNSRMAETVWLAASAIPSAQRHAMPAELGPHAAALAYAAQLESAGRFDLVLLGLGEDGHTASLFPGHPHSGAPVLAVCDAPKPPPLRVSLSSERLCAAHHVWFAVTGSGKRAALHSWQTGGGIPAARVHGIEDTRLWITPDALPPGA